MAIIATSALYGTGVYGASSFGAVNVAITISGVSATGSIKSVAINGFEIDISERLASVSATGQIGAASATLSVAPTGVSATGSIGTLTHSNTVTIAGVEATGSVATVSENIGLTPSGVEATSSAGSVEPQTSEALLSVSATATAGTVVVLINTFDVTVADDGSGDVFYLRGVARPTLTFNRGNTYTFDLSHSSNTGHQLAFKDALGSTFTDGVTTTGTPGTSGAEVVIVVDGRAPSTLNYYCTVHGDAMGNTITVNYDSAYTAIYGLGEYGKARYGIAFVVEAVTGVEATGSIAPVQVNGFEIDIGENLDSAAATGAVGPVQVNLTVPITGVEGVGQQNSVVINAVQVLTGVSATGFVNTVEEKPTEVLLSVSATMSVGTVSPNITAGISGVFATLTVNLPAPSDAITVFTASAYDRKRTAHVSAATFQLYRVDTGAAASAYSRERTVRVLPSQTSQNRRAA